MSPETIGLIGAVAMVILLLVGGMWIGTVTAVVGFIGIVLIRGLDQALSLAGILPYQNVSTYQLTMMPMFILMGMIVSESGIGAELYEAAHKWLGRFKGGLASASVAACGALGALTGSSMTGIMVLSKVALPEMKKYNYDARLASGCIAAGSTIACLIPPSVPFILYGLVTEQSVGKLFIAGIIPGLLQVAIYVIIISILCQLDPKMGPPGPKSSLKEKIVSLKGSWPIIVLFLLVMGGLYGGIFTVTEAGAIGAAGALLISIITRRITLKGFLHAVTETGLMTGTVLYMIVGTYIFQSLITVSKIPFWLGDYIVSLNAPGWLVLIILCIMYLIMGCFLPGPAMIMLTMPVVFPLIQQLGFDPIWFGVIVVTVTEMGSITPPVGLNAFVISGLNDLPLDTVFRGCVPFVLAGVILFALLIIFPEISLFLPQRM